MPIRGVFRPALRQGYLGCGEIYDGLHQHCDAEHADEGGRSQWQCCKSRLDKLIRLKACRKPLVPATPMDAMVIVNPKLNAATAAAPNVNWQSWR